MRQWSPCYKLTVRLPQRQVGAPNRNSPFRVRSALWFTAAAVPAAWRSSPESGLRGGPQLYRVRRVKIFKSHFCWARRDQGPKINIKQRYALLRLRMLSHDKYPVARCETLIRIIRDRRCCEWRCHWFHRYPLPPDHIAVICCSLPAVLAR